VFGFFRSVILAERKNEFAGSAVGDLAVCDGEFNIILISVVPLNVASLRAFAIVTTFKFEH
jgi:hypothetical protein